MSPTIVAAPEIRPGAFFFQMLEQYGDMADQIVFASDYPHWDADDPDSAFPVNLPPELQRKIYFDNAARLYNLA